LERFQSAGFVVEVSQIVMHEADEPDAVVGLFYADGLTGEDRAEIDLAVFVADAAAGGDGYRLVVEGIVEVWETSVGTG
jgi:hypothetical protein